MNITAPSRGGRRGDGKTFDNFPRRRNRDSALFFEDGALLTWRNGDTIDPHSGLKCFGQGPEQIEFIPMASVRLDAYSWVYVWPEGDE